MFIYERRKACDAAKSWSALASITTAYGNRRMFLPDKARVHYTSATTTGWRAEWLQYLIIGGVVGVLFYFKASLWAILIVAIIVGVLTEFYFMKRLLAPKPAAVKELPPAPSDKEIEHTIHKWREILTSVSMPWVVFEYGTCVMVREPSLDVAAQATGLLQQWGSVVAATPSGDMEIITLQDGEYVIGGHHADIWTYVECPVTGGMRLAAIGILGRSMRDADAHRLKIVHVEKPSSPTK